MSLQCSFIVVSMIHLVALSCPGGQQTPCTFTWNLIGLKATCCSSSVTSLHLCLHSQAFNTYLYGLSNYTRLCSRLFQDNCAILNINSRYSRSIFQQLQSERCSGAAHHRLMLVFKACSAGFKLMALHFTLCVETT